MLRYCLEGTGCDIVDAAGGQEALELMRDQLFDLVLLDARMPKVDGASVLGSMRSTERLKDVPVIIVTADVTEETRKAFYDLGADGFSCKPVSKESLLIDLSLILRQCGRNGQNGRQVEDIRKQA